VVVEVVVDVVVVVVEVVVVEVAVVVVEFVEAVVVVVVVAADIVEFKAAGEEERLVDKGGEEIGVIVDVSWGRKVGVDVKVEII